MLRTSAMELLTHLETYLCESLDSGAPRSTEHSAHTGSLPSWFPLFFVAMWLGICTLLAWIAGHMLLLARFPPVDERIEQSFFWASGSMRAGVSFRSALYVGIGSRGLHIAPNWLFRPLFFRGIPCIPWRELRCTRTQPDGFMRLFKSSAFEVPVLDLRFNLAGSPGRAVEGRISLLGGA
jgi:hypothetical protein